MYRFHTRGLAAGLLVAVVGLSGCGDGLRYAEVEGTVTLNGRPLDKVQVEFNPDGRGPRSVAVTDETGKFVLRADDGKHTGAVVGSHKIALKDVSIYPDRKITKDELNQDFGAGKKIRIPAIYGDVTKTPLVKTVNADQVNRIDLEVK
jgi:hypothetical protein